MVTVVKWGLKASFSIATTTRSREGLYSFQLIAPIYPRFMPYNAVLSKEALSTSF